MGLLKKLKLPASGEYLITCNKQEPVHSSLLAFLRIFKMTEGTFVYTYFVWKKKARSRPVSSFLKEGFQLAPKFTVSGIPIPFVDRVLG